MAFVTPNSPNLTDFLEFLSTSVQIPVTALPAGSPWPGYAFSQAMALTPCLGGGYSYPFNPPTSGGGGILYTLAVYNCATHLLFMIAPDQTGQNYFKNLRSNSSTGFGLVVPSTGLIISTSDNGTSATNVAPKWADGMTVGQLGFFRTPYGREYLSYIQSSGPSVVGVT